MKISDKTKDVMTIVGMCIFLCLVLFGINDCSQKDFQKRQEWRRQNPIDAAKERCSSKVRGSRPACWSEGDWAVFCEKVECKRSDSSLVK